MSKLIKMPQFKSLPESTDAANVPENINLWLSKPKQYKLRIQQLLRPDKKGHKGYRFIDCDDLKEVVHTEQFMKFPKTSSRNGTQVEFIFIRRYRRTDKFNPFWFGVESTQIIVKEKYGTALTMYESDAQLKRFILTLDK